MKASWPLALLSCQTSTLCPTARSLASYQIRGLPGTCASVLLERQKTALRDRDFISIRGRNSPTILVAGFNLIKSVLIRKRDGRAQIMTSITTDPESAQPHDIAT